MQKLIYIDLFQPTNSNYHWLKYFQKAFTTVNHVQMGTPIEQIRQLVKILEPDMIHYGGSIKLNSILSLDFYQWVRATYPNIRQTFHYGDAYNNKYNED